MPQDIHVHQARQHPPASYPRNLDVPGVSRKQEEKGKLRTVLSNCETLYTPALSVDAQACMCSDVSLK
jgi:hypothetical protein